MPNYDARLSTLERKAAKLELTARMDEYAEARSDFILAGMTGDKARQEALRPVLAQFAELELTAYAPEPAAAFNEAKAEKDAEEILRKYGLLPAGTGDKQEPVFHDPRSHAVSVTAGDAGRVFTEQDASDAADRILRAHGLI